MEDADEDRPDVLNGAVELAEFMRTCLGPAGQRKLFVFDDGYVATSDVHRVFDEVELPHPAARFVAQHVVAQKEDIGDGSLTALLLSGMLANEARALLEDGLLRATVAKGFERASEVAAAAVDDVGWHVDEHRRDAVRRAVARTALNTDNPHLVDAVVESAAHVAAERRGRNRSLELSDVRFRVETGERSSGSPVELVHGVVLEYEPVDHEMAYNISEPSVAVIGGGKKAGSGVEEPRLFRAGGNEGKGRTEVSFSTSDPDDLTEFREVERDRVREQVDRLTDAGVDVVFCSMGISDAGKRLLRETDITAFRALTETDVSLIARATGATVVMDIADMTPDAVGHAAELRVDSEPTKPTVALSGCAGGGVVTIVLTTALNEFGAERERDLRAAISVVLDTIENGRVVPAGGGIETELAAAVREAARRTDDRTMLAMEAYATALETVPHMLATNAGIDGLTTLTRLRGNSGLAFDTADGEVDDAYPDGPLTTPRVARATVETATHVIGRLLRIDDILTGEEDDDWIPADEIDPRPVPERDFDY
jgi:chaperonin GroEL (HSP60 family)